jgi:hypothetical protein
MQAALTVGAAPRHSDKHDLLKTAAELYREAVSWRELAKDDPSIDPDGWRRAPTAYVAHKLGYHRGHAGRLLTEARALNYLGPAKPGSAGERPARRVAAKGRRTRSQR